MGLSHHEIKYESSGAIQLFVINQNGHQEGKKRKKEGEEEHFSAV